MESRKIVQMHLCSKQKQRHRQNSTDESMFKAETETQTLRTNIWTPRWEGSSGINWEIGTGIYTQQCIKQITSENLLYSTGGKKRRYDLFVGR